MNRLRLLSIVLPAFFSTVSATAAPLFEKDIRPILKEQCFHCHGEAGEKKAGLDVRLVRFLVKGGESGPAVVPGDPEGSPLLHAIRSGEMPKEKPRLSDQRIALIETWIRQGAKTARPEPESIDEGDFFTEEERSLWSLQPIDRPEPPETGEPHPIDAFVARRLGENGLSFSEQASPATLIRRATFDLTGLPPTPGEVDAFLAASREDPDKAFRGLVDRLLASSAYGERWGRHWLDVAGYADSEGVTEKDPVRAQAWRYRDYVIASLNRDKPFDEFVREQLAGDEIAAQLGLHANSPTDEEKARFAELVTATGFLRMAPDGTGVKNDLLHRNQSITDTMKIVGTSLYGMTVQCAECHDHRYDPISQADFFRLRAVFEPGFQVPSWRSPAGRMVSLQTAEGKAEAAKIEEEAKKVDQARLEKQAQFIGEVLVKELEKAPADLQESLRTAYETVAKERTPEQVALLKQHPRILQLSAGSLYLYDRTYGTKNAAILKEMSEEAAKIRATKPKEDFVRAFAEVPAAGGKIPATHLLQRGDPEAPGEEVQPSDLTVLAHWRSTEIPADDASLPTSGRRLALATALTDGEHPLLARVMVNRVWMHHFGAGIVETVADFGELGEKPSHPELLDWLASEFMAKDWSLKELHRLILTSRTWRQESLRDGERERIDPDNRLLSRQNQRRLEAETLRDSLLAVSGKLRDKFGGEPVPVMLTEEGQVILGNDTTDAAGRQTGKYISLEGEEFRRSVYVQVRRSRPLGMFAAFDAPAMTEVNCEIRPVTTVSPQSLLLMNNLGMREFAQHFATRLEEECGTDADTATVIERAWMLAYGRKPTAAEAREASDYLTLQTAWYMVNPADLESVAGPADGEEPSARFLGLAAFTHALLSANEFLYLD